jgi:hypothetical protein
MGKLFKDFCVAALRKAGYEDAARWLNYAPKQATEKVAKIVMRGLGFKRKVDEQRPGKLRQSSRAVLRTKTPHLQRRKRPTIPILATTWSSL